MRQKKKSPKIIKKQNLQIDFRLRVYNKAVNRKKPHQGGVTVKKLLALTIALTVFVTSASACSKKEESSDPAPEKKVEYTKKEVNAYPLGEKEPLVFSSLFREDLPDVPIISAEDYLNQLFTEKISVKKGDNGTVTFTNAGFTMTMDSENDTVSSDCIECFVLANHKAYSDDAEADYIKEKGVSTEDEIKPFSLDLSKYDIDIAESDGMVYLPFCTLGDLFADTGSGLLYKNGELFFKSAEDTMNASGGQGKLQDTRTKEMADFCYRELCMTMDTVYGKPPIAALADSIREKGFDKTLDTFNSVTPQIKKLIKSESTKDYCKGMRLLSYYLNDGGHTQMDYGLQRMDEKYGVLNTAEVAKELLDESDPEYAAICDNYSKYIETKALRSSLVADKSNAYDKLECVISGGRTNLYRLGDTYFFDFNAFENSIIEPFKNALDYAKENNGKNFVIDLSTNDGGSDYVVNYMLSVMLGNDTHRHQSIASGSTFTPNILVDKNLDGIFDEKDDAVSYDFRFAIITSQYSYSNANCMPCAAQERGVAILGEKSGGGSCVVSARYAPEGNMYVISGTSHNIHPDGSYVDDGTNPDTALQGAEKSYSGFYDFDAINKGIDAFYSK